MNNPTTIRKFLIAGGYVAVLAFTFFLLFYHLENHLLWGDEAETAVLAKNVVQFGVPQTYDGTNYIILHGTVDETRDHIWIWSPWMQEYLAASSFILFGPTTWAARAPFALIGWCSLGLLALVAYRIYRSHWVALASLVLLGTSEIFLLHTRQCRYYSISVFGEILFVYGIHQLFAQNRRAVWLAALALVVQFYSSYIVTAANLPALFILAWMLRRRGRRAVLGGATIFGILTLAAAPWLMYAHPWDQSKAIGGEHYMQKAAGYLVQFHFYFLPLCFLLLPLLGLISYRKNGRTVGLEISPSWEQFVMVLLPTYFIIIVFVPGFYLRYLLPILPVACLLAAAWVFRYIRWRALAVLVLAIQSASNAFPVIAAVPFGKPHMLRFPVVDFVKGMASPYTDRFADVLDFFRKYAHPGERVLSFDPEFPLIFYTHLGVINGRIMAPAGGRLPDWVLPLPASGVVVQKAVPLPAFLKSRYDKITIPVHDSPLADSYPEPEFYQYHTVQARVPFVIYKLKAETNTNISK